MVISVFLTLEDELCVVPRQEAYGVERFDIFLACLAVELFFLFSADGVVSHEATVVLVAVEFEHIDRGGVGAPRYVGEISVGGVSGVEINGLLGVDVVDAHADLMACHSRHGIFVGFESCHAFEGVDLWIVGDHCLVHAVEGETAAVGTPEESALDAKLVAVNGLSIDYFSAAVGGDAAELVVGESDAELVVGIDIGHCFRLFVPVGILFAFAVLSPHDGVLFPVVEQTDIAVGEHHLCLVSIGTEGVESRMYFLAVEQCVDVLYIK